MKYFVLRGKTLELVNDFLQRRGQANRKRLVFCKKHGGQGYYGNELRFDVMFDNLRDETGTLQLPEGWKFRRNTKGATPSDRKLRKEMDSPEYRLPGGSEITKILGIPYFFPDMMCRTPLVDIVGTKVIVGVHDTVKSVKDGTRISDLEFEKMKSSQSSEKKTEKRKKATAT